jgi:hypothetical protein
MPSRVTIRPQPCFMLLLQYPRYFSPAKAINIKKKKGKDITVTGRGCP